jgi:hypothetical protein
MGGHEIMSITTIVALAIAFIVPLTCVPGQSDAIPLAYTSEVSVSDNTDFRNCTWGMTVDEVKAAEGDVDWFSYDSSSIKDTYYSKIGANNCTVYFLYDNDDKLYKGIILFTDEYTTDYFYITTFESLVEALTDKYGEPYYKLDGWFDDYYKNDKTKWGLAVVLGDLGFLYSWETNNTNIDLTMMSEKYKVFLTITYEDKNHTEEKEPMKGL